MAIKQYSLYRLRFTSFIHLGNNRDDYGTSLLSYASDSIYAALTATLAKSGDKIPGDGDLGCVVSALFPFYQKDQETPAVLFFPTPLVIERRSSDAENGKSIKRIQWVDLDYLSEVLHGEDPFTQKSIHEHICGAFLSSQKCIPTFVHSEVIRRVNVSRNFEESIPFFMDRISFSDYSGLFFLAEGDTTVIDRALPLLSSEGIGTDRSVGNGHFLFEKDSLTLNLPEDAGYGLSLSTLIPESEQQLSTFLSGSSAAYELSRRGGWISTPPNLTSRKNCIYAFTPGSVLYGLSSGQGTIVDLAPSKQFPHPVWRCGKALVLPILINYGTN